MLRRISREQLSDWLSTLHGDNHYAELFNIEYLRGKALIKMKPLKFDTTDFSKTNSEIIKSCLKGHILRQTIAAFDFAALKSLVVGGLNVDLVRCQYQADQNILQVVKRYLQLVLHLIAETGRRKKLRPTRR